MTPSALPESAQLVELRSPAATALLYLSATPEPAIPAVYIRRVCVCEEEKDIRGTGVARVIGINCTC